MVLSLTTATTKHTLIAHNIARGFGGPTGGNAKAKIEEEPPHTTELRIDHSDSVGSRCLQLLQPPGGNLPSEIGAISVERKVRAASANRQTPARIEPEVASQVAASIESGFIERQLNNAMSLPCHCHAVAMSLPCRCHVCARPCHRCHVIAMSLPCHCRVVAMSLPCHCHAIAMSLPCPCHVSASPLP